jgi:hypothetical protein
LSDGHCFAVVVGFGISTGDQITQQIVLGHVGQHATTSTKAPYRFSSELAK